MTRIVILSLACLQLARSDPVNNAFPSWHPQDDEQTPNELWKTIAPTWEMMLKNRSMRSGSDLPHIPCISKARVMMSDGTLLFTKIVNPWPCDKKKSAVLVRSPYGGLLSENMALIFTALNGYVAVMQDQRGTWKSKGKFNMWQNDGQDSRETMYWIRNQSWSNGAVYAAGMSADGISSMTPGQVDNAPVKGQWSIYTAGDGHTFVYPQGMYRHDLLEGYMNFMTIATRAASKLSVIPTVRHHEAFGPWWYNLTSCKEGPSHLVPPPPECRWKYVHWPVVHNAGWWDIFSKGQPVSFEGIRTRSDPAVRDKHVFIVDPLGHCAGGVPGTANLTAKGLKHETRKALVMGAQLAAEFFNGTTDGKLRSRVGRINFFVMSNFGSELFETATGNFWTSVDKWPVPHTKQLHLHKDHRLLSDLPTGAATPMSYVYNPHEATPMYGGNNLPLVGQVKHCGSADQSMRDQRQDVVVFDSDVLDADLPVVGQITAKLFVSSTAHDTDFVVTISDLHDEKSMLVRYGAIRMRWRSGESEQDAPLELNQVYEVDVDLQETAYIFAKGHKVRVTISSAAYPYYDANPNTGRPLSEHSFGIQALNTIHISQEHPSQVMLPVVSMKDIPRNPHFNPDVTRHDASMFNTEQLAVIV